MPKNAIFVGGQNELTLVTLLQNSAKITSSCRKTEDILGKFGLQASSCIHFCKIVQKSPKCHTRQTDILGKFGLQAFLAKKVANFGDSPAK